MRAYMQQLKARAKINKLFKIDFPIGLIAFIEQISLQVPLIGVLNVFNYHVALQTRLNYISNSKFISLSTNQPRKCQAQTSLGTINSKLIKLGE